MSGVGSRCFVVTFVRSRDFQIHETGMMIGEMFGTETERFLTGNEGADSGPRALPFQHDTVWGIGLGLGKGQGRERGGEGWAGWVEGREKVGYRIGTMASSRRLRSPASFTLTLS